MSDCRNESGKFVSPKVPKRKKKKRSKVHTLPMEQKQRERNITKKTKNTRRRSIESARCDQAYAKGHRLKNSHEGL